MVRSRTIEKSADGAVLAEKGTADFLHGCGSKGVSIHMRTVDGPPRLLACENAPECTHARDKEQGKREQLGLGDVEYRVQEQRIDYDRRDPDREHHANEIPPAHNNL